MKYVNQSVEVWEQEAGINGIYKQIERAGRTCYKSEDKITEDSAKSFVFRMLESKHTAMLEHGTVYLYFKHEHDEEANIDLGDPYDISLNLTLNPHTVHKHNFDTHETFYTTNLRVLVEMIPDGWEDVLKKHAVDYDNRFVKRTTAKFITSRQISHEFVRHRVFSFAQESTRYCNYSKDKFGGELTFIDPCWAKKKKAMHEQLTSALKYSETYYKFLLAEGCKPEEAAAVLPNDLKTELVMTGTADQWDNFFKLRAEGITGKPHPMAQEIAVKLKEMMQNNG